MLRIAVVGAGHWGPNLIANFSDSPRSEVAWVVDADPSRLRSVEARFPEARVATQLDPALDDDVDAIVIATPTSTHHRLARQSLESGKHVLIEKPMADNSADARDLCQLAHATGRVLLVGHVFLFNDAALRAKQCIDAGDLGRIYYISMVRTNLGPIRVDVNAAWDLAAHDIALASFWLDAEPRTVSAVGGAWINPGLEDAVFATLRFPDDVLVNLHASWLHPRKARDITVVGERRMLTFDDLDLFQPLHIYDKQVGEDRIHPGFVDSFESFRMSVQEGKVTAPFVAASQPLRNECEHFLDCILKGEAPRSGAGLGLCVVETLEALTTSLAEGGREVALAGRNS